MFCPNCGSPVPDHASFCGKCGNKLTDEPTPVGGAAFNPNPAPRDPQTWDAYFLMRWKDFLSSGLVVTLLCCATLLQLLGAAANPMESIYDVMGTFGVPSYYIRDALGGVSAMMNSAKLIGMVPGILTVVSLWLMFVDARKGGPRLSTTGMTIIQVLQTIGLVGICLVFGILLIALLAAMSEISNSYYYSSSASSGMGVVIAIVIAIGVLCIFVYAKILSAIKSVKYTLTTFTPCYDSMMFVGVLSIIGGSISALSALSMLSYGFSLSLILTAAVPILYGVVAIAYKNLMEELVPVRDRMMKGQG